MKKYSLGRCFILMLGALSAIAAAQETPDAFWIHPQCQALSLDTFGPFVLLEDGAILTVSATSSMTSRDEGKTWESSPLFPSGVNAKASDERALIRTRDGVLILGFLNTADMTWLWNDSKKDADPGTRLPTCVIRSLDNGKTWQDYQVLHEEWSGCVRNMIQTRNGRVILTAMRLLNHPGRHSVLTYVSDDNGATWGHSNIIDLGGAGHHDGATEGTIEQLNDGRVWQLIRTNWDRFWEAYSEDEGLSWRVIRPSAIDASSSPGLLKRLASGRLALVWNRLCLEGQTTASRQEANSQASEAPASWQRAELSIAFSEDEGKTWSKPVVFARKPGASLAYPYVFERHPGELWITTMFGPVRVRLMEKDFFLKE